MEAPGGGIGTGRASGGTSTQSSAWSMAAASCWSTWVACANTCWSACVSTAALWMSSAKLNPGLGCTVPVAVSTTSPRSWAVSSTCCRLSLTICTLVAAASAARAAAIAASASFMSALRDSSSACLASSEPGPVQSGNVGRLSAVSMETCARVRAASPTVRTAPGSQRCTSSTVNDMGYRLVGSSEVIARWLSASVSA